MDLRILEKAGVVKQQAGGWDMNVFIDTQVAKVI